MKTEIEKSPSKMEVGMKEAPDTEVSDWNEYNHWVKKKVYKASSKVIYSEKIILMGLFAVPLM